MAVLKSIGRAYLMVLLSLLLGLLGSCDDDPPLLDSDGLLTDAGLETKADPEAPTEDQAVVAWIQSNHMPIRSLEAEDFSDLTFLAPLVANKRTVQLGESGHGVKEFNQVKTRLIKYLHQELGYNIIAFESGLFECYRTEQLAIASREPRASMNQSIFGIWHTEEVLELFEYIKTTRDTDDPLLLAGFDVQYGSLSSERRRGFVREVIESIDADYALEVFGLESTLYSIWQADREITSEEAAEMVAAYEQLVTFIDDNRLELEDANTADDVLVARQIARYAPFFIAQTLALDQDNFNLAVQRRDEGMAMNVEFLMDELYPDQKIMIWAHNFHIRYNNQDITPIDQQVKSMGGWLVDRREEMYTVGLYMYRGQAADIDRNVYNVASARSGHLESIFYRTRRKFTFLDLANQQRATGNDWIFERTVAKEWGLYSISLIPRDNYDAIVFIDTVSPPDYLN